MECKFYIKNEHISENKEILIYGFKHIKTDKIDKYILFGCESDDLYEYDKLFTFLCNNLKKKEIELKNFKITAWSSMTLFKRNNLFKFQGIGY